MKTPETSPHPEQSELPARRIKIGLTGSLSSGKSTLLEADHFHPHHPIHLVEEQARILFDHQPMDPAERLTFRTQYTLATMIRFAEYHAERAAAGDEHPVFICDRTVADALAYAYMGGDYRLADQIHHEVGPWLTQYDRILICDINGVPFTPDPVRNESPEFRVALHQAYQEVFDHYGIGYEVLAGTLEEREARLVRIIDECRDAAD